MIASPRLRDARGLSTRACRFTPAHVLPPRAYVPVSVLRVRFWQVALLLLCFVVGSDWAWGQSGQSKVELAWNPAPDAVGYRLYQGRVSGVYTSTLDLGNATQKVLSNLAPGVTYYFTVTSYDSSGIESGYSDEVTYTVPIPAGSGGPVPDPTLPASWQATSVGTPRVTESATGSGDAYTIAGAGKIYGTADTFLLVWQPLTGDGEIIAEVDSLGAAGASACAGVMIRESLTRGSRYAFMGLTGAGKYRWQRRTTTSASTFSSTSGSAVPPAAWVRLVRRGNGVYGYKSSDGAKWMLVASRAMSLASTCYIGLAVASGSDSALNNPVFSNVTVSQ